MARINIFLLISLVTFIFSTLYSQTSITFTFANGQVTGLNPEYYEFDIMAKADRVGTRLGDNQVYFTYNDSTFGDNICLNDNITVTKGILMHDSIGPVSLYNIVNVIDNTPTCVGITVDLLLEGNDIGSILPTIPTQLFHLKIEIQKKDEITGLYFQQTLMNGQQFESDNSRYDPVIIGNNDDTFLTALDIKNDIHNYPEEFILYPNFPNPFNPNTTICFDIPATVSGIADTRLIIFNTLGQVINTLFNDKVGPGKYQFDWDGRTNSGELVPSEMYFAELIVNGISKRRKLILVR